MKRFVTFAFALAAIVACHDGQGPTTPTSPDMKQVSAPSASASTVTQGVGTPDAPVCTADSLGVTRRDITHRTEGLRLYVYVPATNADYADVWTPSVNGTKLGRGPVNEEFSVLLPGYGTYQIQLAIERRTGNSSQPICQDDRNHFTVTIPAPPPPPPPSQPPPTEPPVDVCPNLEGLQLTVPDGYVLEDGICIVVEPPPPSCIPEWTQISDVRVSYGDWSECVDGQQTRIVTYTTKWGNQCNDETEIRTQTSEESQECVAQPESCIYEVRTFKSLKKVTCEFWGGTFLGKDASDHCAFDFPGISNDLFNLAGAGPQPGCLTKHD